MKRKSVVYITLITICIFVFLTGCGSSSTNGQENVSNTSSSSMEEQKNEVAGLILISNTIDNGEHGFIMSEIMYDPETLVMYVLVRDDNNAATASGFSVMLNADGTPRLYNPEN